MTVTVYGIPNCEQFARVVDKAEASITAYAGGN